MTLLFEFLSGLYSKIVNKPEADESNIIAVFDKLSLADLKKAWTLFWLGSGSHSPRISDCDWALFILCHRPEHIRKLILIDWLHMHNVRNVPQVANVKQAVMSGTIVPGESPPVHAKADRKPLQRHIMNNHVVGPLHKGGIDCQKGFQSLSREATCKQGSMLLCDADIEVASWNLFLENFKFGSTGHRCCNRNDFIVFLCKVGHGSPENLRVGGVSAAAGRSIDNVVGAKSVELAWLFKRRSVAAAFFGNDVKDNRFFLLFEIFKGPDQKGEVVAVNGTKIADAKFFE